MRGLLSAARRTGVLGKNNASPAPVTAASGLLPSRRVPSAGLGPPTASLLEAQKAAAAATDRLIRQRRQRRRLPLRASAAAAEPSSAASAAPRGEKQAAPPSSTPPTTVPPAEASFGDLTDQGVIANSTGLQLLFLGTGAGPAPTRGRGAPCVAVRTPHASWLFDCGDDSQRALVREVPVSASDAAEGGGGNGNGGGGNGGNGNRGGGGNGSAVASAPVRHGRISAFFVTSRFGGGALGLPGMLCISSASRVVKGAAPQTDGGGGGGGGGAGGLPPTSVSVFGPPGIANFLNEMLTLSDTYLAMPVLVYEFGYGGNNSRDAAGRGGLASMVAPSQRGSGGSAGGRGGGSGSSGAVPVPRLLSRRAKLSVATLLPDELNPYGFYDLQRAPKLPGGAGGGQGADEFDLPLPKGRTLDPEEADRVGFGYGFDARSGIREPDCLPGPGDPTRAVDGLLRDPTTATWTLRFDREFVVRCVPLIARAPPASSSSSGRSDEEGGGGAEEEAAAAGTGKKGKAAAGKTPPTTPPPSAAPAAYASAPGPDALGYVIRESARAGKIDAELAVSLGVTRGPMMAELKAGRSVTVAVPRPPPDAAEEGWGALEGDGVEAPPPPETRVVRPEDVVSPDRPGRVVAILGDPLPPRSDAETLLPPPSSPSSSSSSSSSSPVSLEQQEAERASEAALAAFSAIVEVARDADLFVAGASAAAAAAEVADRAGASALVLTRFGKGDPTGSGGEEEDGASGSESEGGYESGDGGKAPQQQKRRQRQSQRRRRRKRYDDEDLAAEAEAVLAARDAAGPRLGAKVAAARDLDMVVLSRREPVFGDQKGL